MKLSIHLGIAAAGLFAALALPVKTIAQQPPNDQEQRSEKTRYTIVDLGLVGPGGEPFMISNNALIAGFADVPDGSQHATLWFHTQRVDIGAPGLGGPNSNAFGINQKGEAVGEAQGPDSDDEDFCGFTTIGFLASNTTCLPFVWRHGAMHSLPTLGGPNGFAYMINDRSEVAGVAENPTQDSGCPVHQFQPVVWKDGQPKALETPGELYGVAAYINAKGQVSGASGHCAPFNFDAFLYLIEDHAMLWDADGTPHELPSLGGIGGLPGNHACALNNRGQAVGHSLLPDNTDFHAALWPDVNSITDLGTLPAPLNYASLALGINDRGQVVGVSLDVTQTISSAFIWENGVMTDLNQLVKGTSNLTLVWAESINDRGEIVGYGTTSTNEVHGYLAIPSDDDGR